MNKTTIEGDGMYGEGPSATVTAMLAKVGFENTTAIYAARRAATDPATERVLDCLTTAFHELQYAEDQLSLKLRQLASSAQRELTSLEKGYSVGAGWIGHDHTDIVEYATKRQAAIDRITGLAWILSGEPQD